MNDCKIQGWLQSQASHEGHDHLASDLSYSKFKSKIPPNNVPFYLIFKHSRPERDVSWNDRHQFRWLLDPDGAYNIYVR